MWRSAVKSATRSPVGDPLRSAGGLVLPRAGLLFYSRNGVLDTIGQSVRPIQPLQNMTGGTLTHVDLVGDETVVSNGGTGSVAVSAGTLTITGTVWDIVLSNGWRIPFGDEAAGVAWEVATGSHLIMTGVTCGTSLIDGSDWLNQQGWTTAVSGTHYLDEWLSLPLDNGLIIPATTSTGCSAFVGV